MKKRPCDAVICLLSTDLDSLFDASAALLPYNQGFGVIKKWSVGGTWEAIKDGYVALICPGSKHN